MFHVYLTLPGNSPVLIAKRSTLDKADAQAATLANLIGKYPSGRASGIVLTVGNDSGELATYAASNAE